MAKRALTVIKSWFRKGAYPTEGQFADTFDSFRHKDDELEIHEVKGLQEALNDRSDGQTTGATMPVIEFGGFVRGGTIMQTGLEECDTSRVVLDTGRQEFFYTSGNYIPRRLHTAWMGSELWGTSVLEGGIKPYSGVLYLDVSTMKLYIFREKMLREIHPAGDEGNDSATIEQLRQALTNITGLSLDELTAAANASYLNPATINKSIKVLRFGGFISEGEIKNAGSGQSDVSQIKFHTVSNEFCVVDNDKLYGAWPGSTDYGKTYLGGVVPSQDFYYLDITDGKLYVYDGETLVER